MPLLKRQCVHLDVHPACWRFEPRILVIGRLECVGPSRQVARVAQELEHFGTWSSDLNALDIKHAHGRLLHGLKGPLLSLDDAEVLVVTGTWPASTWRCPEPPVRSRFVD